MKNISLRTKAGKVLRARGVFGAVAAAVPILFPPKAKTFGICRDLVAGRSGFEIGGPSGAFRPKAALPLYPEIARLDNCNFASQTVWEGSLTEGINFQFDPDKPKGRQYIREATDLHSIPDEAYDFVLSCHALEHSANPLGALKEWMRILKADGGIVLMLPHREPGFDRRRPVTTLEHLIEDFKQNTPENDRTHLAETLALTDLDRYWDVRDLDQLKERCENNLKYRSVHHHVFTTALTIEMFDFMGMQVLSAESLRPFHIIVSAKKLPPDASPGNEPFLDANAAWRKNSPFRIDRV